MKRYEYKVIWLHSNSENEIEKELKEYGNDGWELICMRGDYTYIFKREIIDNKKEEGL